MRLSLDFSLSSSPPLMALGSEVDPNSCCCCSEREIVQVGARSSVRGLALCDSRIRWIRNGGEVAITSLEGEASRSGGAAARQRCCLYAEAAKIVVDVSKSNGERNTVIVRE
jgi:hypothetical protein